MIHGVFSILMDLAVFKWRWLANFYIHFESIGIIGSLLVPTIEMSIVTNLYFISNLTVFFLIYWTNQRGQIAFLSILHLLLVSYIEPVIYKGSMM